MTQDLELKKKPSIKDLFEYGYAAGTQPCRCSVCERLFTADSQSACCSRCARKMFKADHAAPMPVLIRIERRDYDALIAALDEPWPVNSALRAALRKLRAWQVKETPATTLR